MVHIYTNAFVLSSNKKRLQSCFPSAFWSVHLVQCLSVNLEGKMQESTQTGHDLFTPADLFTLDLCRASPIRHRKETGVYYSNSPKYEHPVTFFFCCFFRVANNREAHPKTQSVNSYWGWVMVDWLYLELVWSFRPTYTSVLHFWELGLWKNKKGTL